MKKVQVLLSSYNGERYIREQIDSILKQKNVIVDLLVRDDGSKDGTRAILAEYQKHYENIHIVYAENVGVIKSFFSLINQVKDAEYIAFADQDDVWLPNKLIRAVTLLEKEEKDIPLVYCSAKQLVDENLNPIPAAMTYKNVRTEFGNALVENMCTGCTCVVNHKLLELMQGKTPNFTVMHDFWIYLVGTCFGKVIYDEQSYILYRQHGKNELGMASSIRENYRRRVKNFRKHRGQLSRQAEELIRIYGTQIRKEELETATFLIRTRQYIKPRIILLQKRNIFRQRKSDDRILKTLLLFGLL